MSPGRLPGALTPELRGKMRAGRVRANAKRRLAQARLASGVDKFRGEPTQSLIYTSPGAWHEARVFVDDFDYVEGHGIDDCLVRRLQQGVVYAGSVTCHHETPFQDLTIEIVAATERFHRKWEKNGPDPRKQSLPLKAKGSMEKLPLSAGQLRIIGFLAAGLSSTEMARRLCIQERTVKSYCDILRVKLGVSHRREIPMAYREKTGKDPFLLVPEPVVIEAAPISRVGSPLTAVVEEMFPESRKGRPLLEVVSELYDSLKGAA